jgi:Asp-tRNA(Asn)/Glu-tRNA(Gln) amidotransferase C subunit
MEETIEEKNTETKKPDVNPLDSLSNLGKDEVVLDNTNNASTTQTEETMVVDPLKAISEEEFDALVMHSNLVTKIKSTVEEKPTEDINPMSEVASEAERELYIKMANKFGLRNIEYLKDTDVRFRLRKGHFIEVYNASK